MSHFRTNSRATESTREERQIKKELPFTVTTIGGKAELAQWKAAQARKQQEWDNGRAERYANARERAIAVLNGAKPTESVHTTMAKKANEAFTGSRPVRVNIPKTSVKPPKVPWYQALGQWLLSKFIDIKFE